MEKSTFPVIQNAFPMFFVLNWKSRKEVMGEVGKKSGC